ncbi:uncharacterized protein LOC126686679 [Mercurialis annua]|uniref:uncharacterized protein LOC126686679 n=1 Tax=Mercurialis annua TaxID=3986 RepID=UPI00215FA4A1|nr:uncharacterized protein LOC126686679 [Mercurialis annua]
MEGFSSMLRKGEMDGRLSGGRVCRGGPTINHLFFTDDSILFDKANVREIRYIKDFINKFERASVQMVNFDKFGMFFSSGTNRNNRVAIGNTPEVREVRYFQMYLGMPTMVGRSRKPIFAFLWDRIHKRMDGWKENYLSKTGREVLIKSIVQAIPTYIMSCFALPISFFNDLQSSMARFYWSSVEDKRKILWITKQVWRLHQFPDSLCGKVFQAKCYPNADVFNTPGNGQSVLAKNDNWISNSCYMKPVGAVNLSTDCYVSFFIDAENGRWDVDGGMFTVKSAYYVAVNMNRGEIVGPSNANSNSGLWNNIWSLSIPSKIKHFLWRIGHNTLACNANLLKKRVPVSGCCARCLTEEETLVHCIKIVMWLGECGLFLH